MNIIDLLALAYDRGYHGSWGLAVEEEIDDDTLQLLDAAVTRWEEMRQEKANAWQLVADSQAWREEVMPR